MPRFDYPCPYDCGHVEFFGLPRQPSSYLPLICKKCGKKFWIYFTNGDDSRAWTDEEFLENHVIDQEKRTIRPKGPEGYF
jgi:hypothetical protein